MAVSICYCVILSSVSNIPVSIILSFFMFLKTAEYTFLLKVKVKLHHLNFLVALSLHDALPGPVGWPLLLVDLKVKSTCIAHREAQAVLSPCGCGSCEAVGAAHPRGGECHD